MADSVYPRISAITEDYLGPATPRFLNRIAMNHIGKPATQLTKKDLPELITWVQMAANVLNENTAEIQAYIEQLAALSKSDKPGKRSSGHKLSAAQ